MSVLIPTKAELWERFRAYVASKRPDLSLALDTDLGMVIAMLIEAQYGIHRQAQVAARDMFVSSETSTEALDKHAEARLGGRKAAVKATGTLALQLTGEDGSEIATGLELVANDGTSYVTISSATVSAGTATVSVEAVRGGASGNRAIGETLTFFQAPSGVASEGTLVVALTGGEDTESDAALVVRLLDAYRNPPAGGRFSDYRQWATAVEGVERAYCYGPSADVTLGRRGLGAIDVAILGGGSGSARIPSTTVRDAVRDAIEAARPALACDVGIALPEVWAIPVYAQVTPKAGYAYEWIASFAHVVQTWTAESLTLTFLQAPSFAAGDRVLVIGQLATCVSVNGTSAVIDTLLTGTIAGVTVYPVSPVTEPVQTAIRALFDALGPARGTAADPAQDWEDTLRLSQLIDAIMSVEGVSDCTIELPETNIVPTDSGAIQLLVPAQVVVKP